MFLGGRLKRLRRELGLTQTRMATDLGVSPSYLNHLERNQRPVTAQVLLRLAQAYDLDLRAFSGEADKGGEADLQEAGLLPGLNSLAFDVSQVVAPTSWYGTLLKGVLNFSPATTWLQAVVWVAYVVPVMAFFVRTAWAPVRPAAPAPAQQQQPAAVSAA